jgi:hypothetical protein
VEEVKGRGGWDDAIVVVFVVVKEDRFLVLVLLSFGLVLPFCMDQE